MKASGNVILVTGGTSGIGFALASRLNGMDNTVIITGRSQERLAAVRSKLPGAHAFVCDQADPAAISRLCGEVTSAFPGLNGLVNNAVSG